MSFQLLDDNAVLSDQFITSFWQRFFLTVSHLPVILPVLVLNRNQKKCKYNKMIYWIEMLELIFIALGSTAHHLCGDVEAQHLHGYNFCVSTKEVLLFTDQMYASTLLNIVAMFGPDVANNILLKSVGTFISVGINGSIAEYDTSDSIRYTWFALVFVLCVIGYRCSYLKGKGRLGHFFEYHVNLTNIVAGVVVMGVAYAMKGFGDGGDYYTIGHSTWQVLALGPGTALWVDACQMDTSLFCWKRRKADGTYYADDTEGSMFMKYPDGNPPVQTDEMKMRIEMIMLRVMEHVSREGMKQFETVLSDITAETMGDGLRKRNVALNTIAANTSPSTTTTNSKFSEERNTLLLMDRHPSWNTSFVPAGSLSSDNEPD